MTVLEVLSAAAIPFEQRERDNVYIECPECGKQHLSINIFSGVWHCWSSDCEGKGFRGVFPSLAEKLQIRLGEGFTLEVAAPPVKDKTLTEEEAKAIENAATNKPEIIEWAASRHLDPNFILKQGVGYDRLKCAIVFPFRDEKGNLVGAKYRRAADKSQWIVGVEPPLYVLDSADLKKERVVIVEGEVDALTLKQFGIPCVATLGASKDKGFGLLNRPRQIYLGYDMDDAGEAGVEKAVLAFGRHRCKRITWKAKDPNDMLKSGMTGKELAQCVRSARSLAKDLKSRSLKDTLTDYLMMLEKAPTKRLSWGYPRLDSFTHGLGGGMFVGVLAEAGTGKTTFIINVARNLAHAGVNVGIASLEEHVTNEVTPKLSAAMIGRNPGTGSFSPEEIHSIDKEIERVQLYEGDERIGSVVDWIRECYFVHDTKAIFIDYLQLLVPDEKDVQLLKETCYAFKKLVKELPELCIVMIIQPRQKQRQMARDGTEQSLKLDGSDARGGAAINQSVDAMLTMKVLTGHPNIVQLEYTKVRGHWRVNKAAWLGQFTQLEYDHATLRQTEVTELIYGN